VAGRDRGRAICAPGRARGCRLRAPGQQLPGPNAGPAQPGGADQAGEPGSTATARTVTGIEVPGECRPRPGVRPGLPGRRPGEPAGRPASSGSATAPAPRSARPRSTCRPRHPLIRTGRHDPLKKAVCQNGSNRCAPAGSLPSASPPRPPRGDAKPVPASRKVASQLGPDGSSANELRPELDNLSAFSIGGGDNTGHIEAYAKLSLKKYRPMAARNENKKVFSGLL